MDLGNLVGVEVDLGSSAVMGMVDARSSGSFRTPQCGHCHMPPDSFPGACVYVCVCVGVCAVYVYECVCVRV